jgi:fructose-1,6-bisphosphatase I
LLLLLLNFSTNFLLHFYKSGMEAIIEAIKKSSIQIEEKVRRSALDGFQGTISDDTINSSGDVQKKLDVITNEIMIDNLKNTKCCSILLSEENEEAIIVEEEFRGKHMVAFDPLDGSSNIDCNVCIGTIFSIYKGTDKKESNYKETDSLNKEILRNGSNIICAGYIIYGPATEMVITIEGQPGVQKFTLDTDKKEYIYTGEIDIRNKTKKIYSINESNCENWFQDMREYIRLYKTPDTKYTQRYIGSMVADVHRTLLYGGMFSYPADKKNKHGKLRVIYECFPISKIMEKAGGAAIIGNFSRNRILDINPTEIHQRTPILMGQKEELVKYIRSTRNILLSNINININTNINTDDDLMSEHYDNF